VIAVAFGLSCLLSPWVTYAYMPVGYFDIREMFLKLAQGWIRELVQARDESLPVI
jgi:hypothetical protein